MTTILTFDMMPAYAGDKVPKIRVFGDAVLYSDEHPQHGYTSRYNMPCTIHGLSIIGPEQSIRAIAAGCAMEHEHNRIRLSITGPSGHEIKGRWHGEWRCRAMRLTRGAMHLVALPEVTVAKVVEGEFQHIIIAEGDATFYDLRRAIYDRLRLCYQTPLIPINQPGQSESERKAGERWCEVITSEIVGTKNVFKRLESHPEQTDQCWSMAGRLNLTQVTLDDMVSKLVRNGSLPFPNRSCRHTSSHAKDGMSLSA